MQKIVPVPVVRQSGRGGRQVLRVAVFENGRILKTVRFGDAGPGPKGAVMTVSFELHGQQFTALNGGPQFKFTEAISLVVNCQTQAEIDSALVDSFRATAVDQGRCGWVQGPVRPVVAGRAAGAARAARRSGRRPRHSAPCRR